MDLWDEITASDFEDDAMALLVDIAGLETAKKLVAALGGDALYVPKVESVIRKARNRRIQKEFTGLNHKELAVKYDLTPRHVRKIVGDNYPDSCKIKEEQLDLF